MKSTFDTIVAGVTKNNAAGKDRQKIIENYIKDDNFYDKFDKDSDDYWSPQDIKEFNWEVYQYDLHESNTIELIPEPDNPYDKNAIKVIHKEMGDLGYIPRKDNVNLAKFINSHSGNVRYSIDFEGGKYKYYDGEKIISGSKPYGLRIYVKSLNQNIEDYMIKDNTISGEPDYKIDYELYDDKSKNSDPIEIKNKNKKDKDKDKDKEKKSSNRYLVACCIGLILAIIFLLINNYFGFILMMLLSLLNLRYYFKESKEDKK